MAIDIGRRQFVAASGCTALSWPFAARAQQVERKRVVGILMGIAESDPIAAARLGPFKAKLQDLGWISGRNTTIEVRWTSGEADQAPIAAKELVSLNPDVIVAHTSGPAIALANETSTIPIVFTIVSDPNATGLVESIARPKRNVTGFTSMEPTLGPKWLDMLKQIAPDVKRVAVIFNPEASPIAIAFSRSVESAAQRFFVEVIATPVHEPEEIQSALALLGRDPGGGFILPPDIFTTAHRKMIFDLADQYRLPAVYPYRYYVAEGGLLSYGSDPAELMRQAAIYVDRILRGALPSELPVQAPTKLELVINLKTAKTLGLTVPPTMLALADDVIE